MPGIWTNIQNVLKYDYLGPIREQLNNSTPYLAQIEKTSKDVVGEGLRIPLHISRNSGVGSRGTDGDETLPTAGNQGYQRADVKTKDTYACINIYGKAIRATRNDKGAFLRQLRSEVEGAVGDAKIDVERQLVASDTTGTLTLTNGGTTAATVTVDSTQYLEEGMIVDIGADTGVTILSIDSATTITMTASLTWGDDEIIKRTGMTSGWELNGLKLFLSDSSTAMGLDVATYPFWKANVVGTAASPVPLTELDMLESCDLVNKKGGTVDYAITAYGGRRAFYNILQSQKRFGEVGQKMKLKGGWNGLVWSAGEKDIPITVNRYWPETATETSFGFLSLKEMAMGQMSDWEWMEEDGNVLARQTGAGKKEAYEGTLVKDCEQITYARNRHTLLAGVTPQ